jgi:very-short-patch-repair endonuclease
MNDMPFDEREYTILQATDYAARHVRDYVPVWIKDIMRRRPAHESPIEEVFEIWWIALRAVGSVFAGQLDLQRQVTVPDLGYRLDFVVRHVTQDPAFPLVAVELDGHDFHERTKVQVRDRDARDRRLQQAGWHVFHFSGSELMADPVRCVREVQAWCEVAVINLEPCP